MTNATFANERFYEATKSSHGYWLINHRELIEPQITSLIKVHGEAVALSILSAPVSEAKERIYRTIERVREAVYETEQNPRHEDDYYNAGGFFAHWDQYDEAERLRFISEAMS